ncbi:MAG: BrnT family toxin [Rhodospirillaceae bacterium]|nr:BrnT family toxin [Rhodospirillaceae bacterium]
MFPDGFEWDEVKNRSNIAKHGVDFNDVAAFDNPMLTQASARRDCGEERFTALGQAQGRIYRIVFTRRGGAIRLISSWQAGADERAIYRAHHP